MIIAPPAIHAVKPNSHRLTCPVREIDGMCCPRRFCPCCVQLRDIVRKPLSYEHASFRGSCIAFNHHPEVEVIRDREGHIPVQSCNSGQPLNLDSRRMIRTIKAPGVVNDRDYVVSVAVEDSIPLPAIKPRLKIVVEVKDEVAIAS